MAEDVVEASAPTDTEGLPKELQGRPDVDQILRGAQLYLQEQEAKKNQVAPLDLQPQTSRVPRISRRGLLKGIAAFAAADALLGGVYAYRLAQRPALSASVAAAVAAATRSPEGTPDKPTTIFAEAAKPFIEEAFRRRGERTEEELARIDQEINANRLNILLFGWGVEHDDKSYEDLAGSTTILSLDLRTNQFASIALSRDILAPELRGKLPNDRTDTIRNVYKAGGFPLMREVVEKTTGLAVDYQLVMRDTVIYDLINKITGQLEIESPKEHDTQSFKMGGKEYPGKYIPAGKQAMGPLEAMYFILAEDKNPDGRKDERSYRKNILSKAIMTKLKDKFSEHPINALKTLNDFFNTERSQGSLILDFDPQIMQRAIDIGLKVAGPWLLNKVFPGTLSLGMPETDDQKELVLHDPYWGSGSVTRVHNIKNAPDDPAKGGYKQSMLKLIEEEKLPNWVLIPDGGNPNSPDLMKDYWPSTRKIIRETLIAA